MERAALDAYLADCRYLALQEIREIIPRTGRYRSVLYDIMLDYPLRSAKALRPALCIATCRALGGRLESVLRSAAVLELYHNAFLIHDDVEDGSEKRRDGPTLHRTHGIPIAVNVGDAMLALSLQPLLDNMHMLGMGKALRILQAIARMARESAEGQAIELDWIRHGQWQLSDADYVRMVYKKTSWYTFITPTIVGGIIANADAAGLVGLRKFVSLLGVAFQMQDDILNLTAERQTYGKDIDGDLWEGKHTVILLHMMRSATASARARASDILRKRRPDAVPTQRPPRDDEVPIPRLLAELEQRGELTRKGLEVICAALRTPSPRARGNVKTAGDIRFLLRLIDAHRSIAYAREIAERWAAKAKMAFAKIADWLGPSVHRDFLEGLVEFVVCRDH